MALTQSLIDDTIEAVLNHRPLSLEQVEATHANVTLEHSETLRAKAWVKEKFSHEPEAVVSPLRNFLVGVADQSITRRASLNDTLHRLDAAWQAGVEQPADLVKVGHVVVDEPHGTLAVALTSGRNVSEELALLGVEPGMSLDI